MNDIKTLFKNKWISLMEITNGNWTYVYSHETSCNGKKIAILPFRTISEIGLNRNTPNQHTVATRVQYLLRSEITPCWGGGRHIASITGGVEDNNPNMTALLELEEEAGYVAKLNDLIPLGICRGAKSMDTIYYLFGIDLSGTTKTKDGEGSGAVLEKEEYAYWAEQGDICHSSCPFVSVMYMRLLKAGKI